MKFLPQAVFALFALPHNSCYASHLRSLQDRHRMHQKEKAEQSDKCYAWIKNTTRDEPNDPDGKAYYDKDGLPKGNDPKKDYKDFFHGPAECIRIPTGSKAGSSRIVGGNTVDPPSKYPFMVRPASGGCGASLVAPNVLLTAAHCNDREEKFKAGEMVEIGRFDIANDQEDYQEIAIVDVKKHPCYLHLDYDYMMVRLSENADSQYKPVELDDGTVELSSDTDCIIMGWGDLQFQGVSSDKLQEAEVDIIQQCGTYTAVTRRMICAGRGSVDSCQGDSGGPMVLEMHSASYTQVGIVSWGFGCGNPDSPGVYSDVGEAYDWMRYWIDRWNNNLPDGQTCTNNIDCESNSCKKGTCGGEGSKLDVNCCGNGCLVR